MNLITLKNFLHKLTKNTLARCSKIAYHSRMYIKAVRFETIFAGGL